MKRTYDGRVWQISGTCEAVVTDKVLQDGSRLCLTSSYVTGLSEMNLSWDGFTTHTAKDGRADYYAELAFSMRYKDYAFLNKQLSSPVCLEILKTDFDTGKPMIGVEFVLEKLDASSDEVLSSVSYYTSTGAESPAGTIVLYLERGAAYRLSEIVPDGYAAVGPWMMQVDADGHVQVFDRLDNVCELSDAETGLQFPIANIPLGLSGGTKLTFVKANSKYRASPYDADGNVIEGYKVATFNDGDIEADYQYLLDLDERYGDVLIDGVKFELRYKTSDGEWHTDVCWSGGVDVDGESVNDGCDSQGNPLRHGEIVFYLPDDIIDFDCGVSVLWELTESGNDIVRYSDTDFVVDDELSFFGYSVLVMESDAVIVEIKSRPICNVRIHKK